MSGVPAWGASHTDSSASLHTRLHEEAAHVLLDSAGQHPRECQEDLSAF